MTDDEINAAIAEACPDKFRNEDDVWFFQYAADCWSQCHNNNICTDLNAMHEAEKVLGNRLGVYGELLCKMTVVNEADFPECYIWHATARQRAEAFLRTLGKWEEVQKVSAKICKCCGGNGWEGSSCESIKSENNRLWREYEFQLAVIEGLRLELARQAKDLQLLEKMKNALLRISKLDWPVTKDFYWKMAKDALLPEEQILTVGGATTEESSVDGKGVQA